MFVQGPSRAAAQQARGGAGEHPLVESRGANHAHVARNPAVHGIMHIFDRAVKIVPARSRQHVVDVALPRQIVGSARMAHGLMHQRRFGIWQIDPKRGERVGLIASGWHGKDIRNSPLPWRA